MTQDEIYIALLSVVGIVSVTVFVLFGVIPAVQEFLKSKRKGVN